MPLVVPKSRYRDGDLIVCLRTQTMYGYYPERLLATLCLAIYRTGRHYTELETWYGLNLSLAGRCEARDLHDVEDWAVEDPDVHIYGAVYGRMNLDDHVEMTQYLRHVLDIIWSDLLSDWYWRATQTPYT